MREDDSLPAARLAVVDLPDGVSEEHELGSPIPANPDKIRMNDWMQKACLLIFDLSGTLTNPDTS